MNAPLVPGDALSEGLQLLLPIVLFFLQRAIEPTVEEAQITAILGML